jgi:type IV secretory pathway TrbD component
VTERHAPHRDPLVVGALAAGVLGIVLLFFLDDWLARALGVLCLFGFIVAGVFAIASPALLDDDEDEVGP